MTAAQGATLAARKQALLIRSAELRVLMTQHARELQPPLALADQAMAATQWLRSHPQWVAGALLLLAVWRPRRALGWASRLWWGWGLYRKARSWLQRTTR